MPKSTVPPRYHKLNAGQKAMLAEKGVTEKDYDKYRSRQVKSERKQVMDDQDTEIASFDKEIRKLMKTTPKLNKGGVVGKKAYMMAGGMANKRKHMYPGGGYVTDKLKGKY